MPPIRTIPPAKAVKTERTHEENQERAYIAASRRSDRSLEARVESARRASEIHKRRTGRSLRVTEQDVINEEMYEEEDDDLPMQYRRLTAHLQTGSADFNRRLAAYLTNQVAMRSAMEQMAHTSYGQPYTNAPQFAQSRNAMLPPSMGQQSMTSSPTNSYRPAPYPMPQHTNFHQSHARAYSTTAAPNSVNRSPSASGGPHPDLPERRMSTPAPLQPPPAHRDATPDQDYHRQTQSAVQPSFPPMWHDMNPFTTTLPVESQQMLGPALDPNDPFTAQLMHGSENYIQNPYYPWGNQYYGKGGMSMQPMPYSGMSATLAPSALDSNRAEGLSATTTSTRPVVKSETASAPSSGLDFNLSQESKSLNFFDHGLVRENSHPGLASGQVTPGDGFWDSFVQEGWNEETVVGS